ncbi:hypothetical protein E9232_001119 [Inquilinus ginsengisoli]|uniref:AlpA family phage regulatory protein n=1 Tax=Inquilinus ginsengisoli TaxID=363840 RepID=A0ABU1JJW2_9PROT|nr:hypothetical protein [Inquilinus ginsengisoli]MDR6288612.1 hypothetical protein [Inquilinus ginsengisoli]
MIDKIDISAYRLMTPQMVAKILVLDVRSLPKLARREKTFPRPVTSGLRPSGAPRLMFIEREFLQWWARNEQNRQWIFNDEPTEP